MKYIIEITTDDKIKLEPFVGYETIRQCVGGYYELCGHLPTYDGGKFDVYCNEEYLLHDECKFNAMATFLFSKMVYGNIAFLIRGYNDEGEMDSLPLSEERAVSVVGKLELFRERFMPTLNLLHDWYDEAPKPEPYFHFVSMNDDELDKMFGFKNEN